MFPVSPRSAPFIEVPESGFRMSGAILWLDPTTIVQASGSVSSWGDRLGKRTAYTQATGANKPTYLANYLNGRPGVHFDSTAKFLAGADEAAYDVGQGSWLYLFVGELVGAAAFRTLWGKCNAATANHFRCFTTGADLVATSWGTDANFYSNSSFTWSTTTPRVIGWGVDAATSERIYVSNGTIDRASVTLSGTGNNAEAPRLNGDTGGGYATTFKQAAALMYSRGASGFSNIEIADTVSALRQEFNI